MKNKFLFLFTFLLLSKNYSFSQWAPNGATWYTGIVENISSPNQGYVRTNSIGDTVLNSIDCKLLESVLINSSGQVTLVDTLIMYSDSGRVYHYRNGSFYLLYDFSLNAGDSWQTIAPYPSPFSLLGNPPDTIVEVVVDSISTITISGIAKKVMYVHSDSNDWYFLNPIIEDIGSFGGLFPYIYDWLDFDIPLLRCYSDSLLQYETGIISLCDTILNSVDEFGGGNFSDIVLYPVPVNERLNFQFNSSVKIESFLLYDEVGRIMMKGEGQELIGGISMVNYSSGIYFIQLLTSNSSRSFRILVY